MLTKLVQQTHVAPFIIDIFVLKGKMTLIMFRLSQDTSTSTQ